VAAGEALVAFLDDNRITMAYDSRCNVVVHLVDGTPGGSTLRLGGKQVHLVG